MKAEELRIGNWVILDWTGDKCPYNKEMEITNFSVLKEFHEGNRQYSGIPLTEEWLEKFGFEDDGEDHFGIYKRYIYMGLQGDFYPIEKSKYGTFCGGMELGNINDKSIDFVHHLQNLYFALTGEELTIKE